MDEGAKLREGRPVSRAGGVHQAKLLLQGSAQAVLLWTDHVPALTQACLPETMKAYHVSQKEGSRWPEHLAAVSDTFCRQAQVPII